MEEVSNDFIASEALRNFKVRWKLILIWLLLKSNKTMTYLLSVILKTTRLRNGITVDIYSVNYCSNYSRVFGVIKSITARAFANWLIEKLAVLFITTIICYSDLGWNDKNIFHMEKKMNITKMALTMITKKIKKMKTMKKMTTILSLIH